MTSWVQVSLLNPNNGKQRLSGPNMKALEDSFNWDDEEEESNEIGCEEK